jgi:hypothetical protein
MAERIFSRMELVACLDCFLVFIAKELPPTVLDHHTRSSLPSNPPASNQPERTNGDKYPQGDALQ